MYYTNKTKPMADKENIFQFLVLLTIISFGFFGSLNHLFTFTLIILFIYEYFFKNKNFKNTYEAYFLFFSLTGIFFVLLIRCFFHQNFETSLASLSPMFPIPFIGLMILFNRENGLRITANQLSFYSQISIAVALLTYLILSQFFGPRSGFASNYLGRLELFSGNPIPFSFAILGVSIFCLFNWENAGFKGRLVAIFYFFIGLYFAGILSGSRGSLLSIILSAPIFAWFLSRSYIFTCTFFMLNALGAVFYFHGYLSNFIFNDYMLRVLNGLDALFSNSAEDTSFSNSAEDTSINVRLEIWRASLKAISEVPLFGYNVSERFTAIVPYFKDNFLHRFSHPHNDVLAGIISVGILGGVFTIVSLFSPVIAALLSKSDRKTKLPLALTIVISVMFTANVNTVFFNDITASWLAFSTFLIWNAKV